jgi:8-oxo-dGTP diphosphatase
MTPTLATSRPTEPLRPTVGVQAAVFRDSNILLQRRAGGFGDGCWGLPGGHLEFGESFEDAASRELEEECGLHATRLRTMLPHNTAYETTHYVQIAVEVVEWDGEPEIREPDRCSKLGFFSFTCLPRPLFAPSERILEHFAGRSTTQATKQRLSISLMLSDHAGLPIRRLGLLLLLGESAIVIQRLHAPDRIKPKHKSMKRFSDPDLAWSWLQHEISRRGREGFVVHRCDGDASLDRVLSLFPRSHSVALQSLAAPAPPPVYAEQLALLPEHVGW